MRRLLHTHRFAGTAVVRVWCAVAAVMLAGCSLTATGSVGHDPPDIYDKVRLADLRPRSPQQVQDPNSSSSGGQQAVTYYGDGKAAPVDGDGKVTPVAMGGPPTPGGEGYALNFENAPVTTVAKVILGDILGVGYTIDPRVLGSISLASGNPVPKNDMLFVLESALRTANVVLVRDAGGYRLVPAADAVGSGAVDRVAAGRPEPGYGISVIPLQFVSVQTVAKLLDSFVTKPGTIRADPARNMLLIVGNGAERRAAVETVLSFDADWMRGQSVGIYPVHNSTPEPLITELEKIIDSGEGGLSQNLVKLQPVGRLNAVLVITRKPELLKTAATWISRLDKSDTAGTGVKVYRIRYGDARQFARLLNDMFVGSGSSGLDSPTNQIAPDAGATSMSSGAGSSPIGNAGPATMSAADRLTGGQSSLASSGARQPPAFPTSDVLGSGSNSLNGARTSAMGGPLLPGVRITADVANNALLIYANQESYRLIERTLRQLDRPKLQVAVDLTIAEVTLNANLDYGVQFYLQSSDLGLKANTGSVINSVAGAVLAQTLPGFNFLIGSSAAPRVILNVLHGVTDVKVLSNPSLVVLDNGVATLQVGDQVPITTGTATVLSANNAVVNTINYQNTGIILHVVPRITANGNVLLEIEQEISSVPDTNTPGTLTPTISQRRVKSQLSVANGQTVLLAGLISETQSRSRNGIPLLDQLPGVGNVFSSTTKSSQRTELIIFIRPQVIRDTVDASVVAEELRTKMRGSRIITVEPTTALVPSAPASAQ